MSITQGSILSGLEGASIVVFRKFVIHFFRMVNSRAKSLFQDEMTKTEGERGRSLTVPSSPLFHNLCHSCLLQPASPRLALSKQLMPFFVLFFGSLPLVIHNLLFLFDGQT